MKPFSYLSAFASWAFFVVMWYLSHTSWESGWTIFLGGSIIFSCISVFLLGASLWKRQGRLTVFGFILLLPVLLGGLFVCQGIGEIGAQEEPLTFIVVDAETQKPIPNALVRLLTGVDKDNDRLVLVGGQSEGRTKTDGSVSLRPELIFTHTHRAFRPSGWIRFWDNKRLEISADGYEPLSGELQEYAGKGRPLYDSPLPPLTIGMKRNQLLENVDKCKRLVEPILVWVVTFRTWFSFTLSWRFCSCHKATHPVRVKHNSGDNSLNSGGAAA